MTDTTATTDPAGPALTADDRQIRARLALTLWMMDNRGALPEGAEARRAAFDAVRGDYLGKAADCQRALARRGVVMALSGEAGEEV